MKRLASAWRTSRITLHSSRVGSTRLEAVTLRRCLIRKVAALLLGARCLR